MKQLFVKICGITRLQDAELAVGLGANALGFVFWPGSPRCVDVEAARAIAESVPANVLKVGVFVDQATSDVTRIMDDVGLDVAQLHGHETPDYCQALAVRLKPDTTETRVAVRLKPDTTETQGPASVASAFRRTIFKSIGMADNGSVNIADFGPDIVLLVDAKDPVRFGGTGRTVNWDAAREIAASRRTILAGGLNAANIKLAIRSVRPFGVDVSSGVESAPGVKDPNRLRSFFEALHD